MWWTSQEDEVLARLASDGLSTAAIAKRVGRTGSAVELRFHHLRQTGAIAVSRRGRAPQPPEIIARIRELAAPNELSAAQIGAMIGLTRNAVIGLCRRHGIKLRAARRRPIGAPPPWAPRPKPSPPRAVAPAVVVDLADYQPPALICEPVPDDLDASAPVAFMDLGAGQCRWIEGRPNGLDTLYCGRRVLHGKSWCRDHFVRAFDIAATKASIRKSRRKAA